MAASSTVNLGVTTTENPGGFTWPGEKSFTNANPPLLADLVTLTTTPVALVFPTGTEWAIIIPPATNAILPRVSGAVGETVGAALHPTRPLYWPLPASGQNLFLFCTSSTIANVQIYYV